MNIEKFTVVDIKGKHPHFPVPVKTKFGIVLFYIIAPKREPFTLLDMESHLEMGIINMEGKCILADTTRQVPRSFGAGQTLGACRLDNNELLVFNNFFHIHNWLGEFGASIIPGHQWTVTPLGIRCMSILETDTDFRFGKPISAKTQDFPVSNGYGGPVVVDGNILFPCDFNTDVTGLAQKRWETPLLISRDSGKSWNVLGMINMEQEDSEIPKLSKPSLALTSDKELICVMQAQGGKQPLYISRSIDSGVSWSLMEPTGLDGYWHTLLTLRDGRLMLAYAPAENSNSIRIIYSEDGGKTWPESEMIIVDDRSKHPCPTYIRSIQLEDDSVLLTYTACLQDKKSRQVVCAILTP